MYVLILLIWFCIHVKQIHVSFSLTCTFPSDLLMANLFSTNVINFWELRMLKVTFLCWLCKITLVVSLWGHGPLRMSLKVPEGRVRLLYLSKWDFLFGEKKKIIGAQWIKEYWLLKYIFSLFVCTPNQRQGALHFFTSLDLTPKSKTGLVSRLIHIQFTLLHIFISWALSKAQ